MKKAFLLFTAAVLFCLTGCSSHSDSEKNNTVPVDTVKILTAKGTSVTVGSTLELQAQIKSAINDLDAGTKKSLQTKLKDSGLPTAFNKVTDVDILKQILDIVSA